MVYLKYQKIEMLEGFVVIKNNFSETLSLQFIFGFNLCIMLAFFRKLFLILLDNLFLNRIINYILHEIIFKVRRHHLKK